MTKNIILIFSATYNEAKNKKISHVQVHIVNARNDYLFFKIKFLNYKTY